MNGIQHHLTRSAALAALLLVGGGVVAGSASADAPVVGFAGGGLAYVGDFAADVDDIVAFDPGVVNGVEIFDVRAAVNMRLDASAAGICVGNGSNTIRCEAATVTKVMAQVGAGDDVVRLLPSSGADPVVPLLAVGGAGDDTLVGGPGGDSLGGEGGEDAISGLGGDDTLSGGIDDDALEGGLGHDELDGGEGDDQLGDTFGNDRLLGGAGRDVLDGGPGSDRLDGGADADVVDYGDRTDPVAVSLDGGAVADDGGAVDDADGSGPATVRDRVVAVETVLGGAGDDELSSTEHGRSLHGGPGDDRLLGGPTLDILVGDAGDDELIGNGGLDAFFGGDGDDEIRSTDGIAEPDVDCGSGSGDRLDGDPGDGAIGCEQRVVPPPVDGGGSGDGGPGDGGSGGGGVTAGQSGAGGGASPGGSGTSSAGTDGAARSPLTAALDARFARVGSRTSVTRLRLTRVPAGTTVTLTCRGARGVSCPVRSWRRTQRRGAVRLDLSARVRGRGLPAGAVLEVRIVKRGMVGRRWRFQARSKGAPIRTTACVAAGVRGCVR